MPRIDMNDIYYDGDSSSSGIGILIFIAIALIWYIICWISDLNEKQKEGLKDFFFRLLLALFFIGLALFIKFS